MGSLYGFEIKGDLPLQRLNAAVGTRGEIAVRIAADSLAAPAAEPDGVLEDDGGKLWYASYELAGEGRLLRLPPTGSFLLEPTAGRVTVERSDEDDELFEHRLASSAICTLLALRGDLVLHAAAVEREGRAIFFCGPTQRGKSTLAQALGAAGCGLLGEDGLAVELGQQGPVAHPGARGVRIRERGGDGRSHTKLVDDPGVGEPGPCPVSAVVLLGERGAALEVEPLEPARALALLTPSLIHSGGRASIGSAFQRLAALLGEVPAYHASLPDDLGRLSESAESLLDATSRHG